MLVAHYTSVPSILERQFGRIPVSWVNFPQGFGNRGVFHKDVEDVPAWVACVPIETSSGAHSYVGLAENALLRLVHAKYAVRFVSWTPRPEELGVQVLVM